MEDLALNIVMRLECLVAHGLYAFPLYVQLSQIHDFSEVCEQSIEPAATIQWTKAQFDEFFVFIWQSQVGAPQYRLRQINWGFGTLFLRQDGLVSAYPSIFKEGELLLEKPWFGWLFQGRMLRYKLFSDGYRQVVLHCRIQQMRKNVSMTGDVDVFSELDRCLLLCGSLDDEYRRVQVLEHGLWVWFNQYACSLSARWKQYIHRVRQETIMRVVQLLECVLTDHDGYVFNEAHQVIICQAVTYICAHFSVVDHGAKKRFQRVLMKHIQHSLQQCLLSGNMQRIGQCVLQFWLANPGRQLLCMLLPQDIIATLDALSCLQSKSQRLRPAELLRCVLTLYEYDCLSIDGLIKEGDYSENERLFVLLRAVFTAQGMADSFLQAYAHVKHEYAIDMASSVALDHADYDERVLTELEQLSFQNKQDLMVLRRYITQCGFIAAQSPLKLESIYGIIDRHIAHYSGVHDDLTEYVLALGSAESVKAYGMRLIQQQAASSNGLLPHLNSDYIVRCGWIYPEVSQQLMSAQQLAYIEHLMQLVDYNATEELQTYIHNAKKIILTSAQAQLVWKKKQAAMYQEPWRLSAYLAMTILSDTQGCASYLRYGLSEALMGDHAESLHVYWQEQHIQNRYYWGFMGVDTESIGAVTAIITQALEQDMLSSTSIQLLDMLLSDTCFVQYYSVQQLADIFPRKRIIWCTRNAVNDLQFRLMSCTDTEQLIGYLDELLAFDVQAYEHTVNTNGLVRSAVQIIWKTFERIVVERSQQGDCTVLLSFKKALSYIDKQMPGSREVAFLLWLCQENAQISSASTRVLHYHACAMTARITQDPMIVFLFSIQAFHPDVMSILRTLHGTDSWCNAEVVLQVFDDYLCASKKDMEPCLSPSDHGLVRPDASNVHQFYTSALKQYAALKSMPPASPNYARRRHCFMLSFENLVIIAARVDASHAMHGFIQEVRSNGRLYGTVCNDLKAMPQSAPSSSQMPHTFFHHVSPQQESLCANLCPIK